MIRYRTQDDAPHLLIELDETVSGSEVRRELADLPDDLQALPLHFVALVVYPDVTLFKANAVGPLFYYVAHLFDADPGLCVFVDGGRSPHPGLRTFIDQIGLDDPVAFVRTQAEADAHIQQHVPSQDEGV
jgi:hypothetical protein